MYSLTVFNFVTFPFLLQLSIYIYNCLCWSLLNGAGNSLKHRLCSRDLFFAPLVGLVTFECHNSLFTIVYFHIQQVGYFNLSF